MEGHRGGLTFVFTDIEGSTRLLRELLGSYGLALRVHQRILQSCFEEHGGTQMGSEGDGLFFVFRTPEAGVAAAVTAQEKVEHYDWPEGVRLRVRMGIHCGPVTISGGEYVGLTVHEVARICAAAHGGQILCSSSIVDGVTSWPDGCSARDLGAFVLRGIPEPRPLFQLVVPDLQDDFPPLREAVRDGGVKVTIWRRDAGVPRPKGRVPVISTVAEDVVVDVRRASTGDDEAFRLVVRRNGTIEEEFDGLTVGGPADAASIVNAHSTLIRVDP